MIPKPIRPLATVAAVITGGLITLNLASTATIKAIRFVSEAKRVKLKSQTISGSQTFFLSFSLLLVFLLLSLIFLVGFLCRERWRCLVGFAEEKGFIYANCAKEMPPQSGRLCMTLWLSILAFAPLAKETGCSLILFYFIFNLLELYFKCLVYNFSFVLCLVAEKTISSLLFYKLNCRKNALNRFGQFFYLFLVAFSTVFEVT